MTAPLPQDLEALTDEQLIAILVGERSAKRLLREAGSLQALARWSLPEIVNRGKVPEKRALALLAGLTAGRRGSGTRLERGAFAGSAPDAYRILRPMMAQSPREQFVILLLDSQQKLLSSRVVSVGTLDATMVHPRDVFAPAVVEHAKSIILAHNHPSGHSGPSEQDIALTRRLVATGDLMGIAVVDHLIVGDQDYYSFAEAGALRT